jgi:hypothetical protein
LDLFERIAGKVRALGGKVVRHDFAALDVLPDDVVPIVGCSPELSQTVKSWKLRDRPFIYWDRGYMRRVFATWLPRGDHGGYYRWHRNVFQMSEVRDDAPDNRFLALRTSLEPWKRDGRHIVIAAPTRTYARFHDCASWTTDTIDALARVTDRQLVIRDKESKRPLQADLDGAHALVTHGSIAAVEAVVLGCPVFVHESSAAALVGKVGFKDIESPVYPDREPWVKSLAYSQFNESELVDGTLWRLL